MEPLAGDTSVGAVGSALLILETLIPSVWSLVKLELSMERMFIAYVELSIAETGVKLIVKVVVPPEVDVLVLQILLLSEGGFNTVKVGAAPLSSVAVNVKVFVFPIETVCVVVGIPIISGGKFEASVVLKKKSIGIYDLLSPLLLSKSSTIIKDNHISPSSVD